MHIMAVDPGRDKCGMAVIDGQGEVLWRQVIETRDLDEYLPIQHEEAGPVAGCLQS